MAVDRAPLPPLHVVLGEEEFLAERAVGEIAARARSTDPGTDVRRHRATELHPADLAEALSPSLFGEGRVVVVQGGHEAGKELATALLDAARDVPGGTVLVVLHAGGARNKALVDGLRAAGAEVVDCPKVRWPNERIAFVRNEVRRLGGKLGPGAAEALAEAVGSELRELAAATAQLVADTGGSVDEAAVRRYHRGKAEVFGWDISDRVVAGDRAGALEALRWAEATGVPAVVIADALASGIRTLAVVGSAGRGDPNRLAGSLGMSPGKVRKAQQQVRSWRPESVAAAVAITAQLNADVKGAAADAGYALERAVLQLCAAHGR
jgi:DNA polymerase-3 subunit delta